MTHRYVARQVIVDREEKAYAYELLYRNSASNFYPEGVPIEVATQDLISTLTTDFSTEELTKGNLAFINFPRKVLLSDAISYLCPDSYVIEILENVEIDDEMVARIHALRKKGYQFAADEYTAEQSIEPIANDLAVVRVNVKATPVEVQQNILDEFGETKQVLAMKIETKKDFEAALEMGYHLFQGFYFARPTLLIRKSIGFSQGAVMGLLKEAREEDVDFEKIENIINSDPGLTFHLLKRGNTAAFAGKTKFTAPSQVVVRMGIEELQKWATLMLMKESAEEGQDEKMELALLRAHFIQSLTLVKMKNLDRNERYYVYLKGMFSVFPENNRNEVFKALDFHIEAEIDELVDRLLEFIYNYEAGNVKAVYNFMVKNKYTDSGVYKCYREAIATATGALK